MVVAGASLGTTLLLAATDSPLPVKHSPIGVRAEAPGASPEVVAELGAHGWDLFDRDTSPSGFRATRDVRLVVDLGEGLDVREVRFRGNDAASVSVEREDGAGGWATIPGLNSIDLSNLPIDRWTIERAGGQVTTRRLSFSFRPRNNSTATSGLTEIEVWGPRASRRLVSLTEIGRAVRSGELRYPYEVVAPGSGELVVSSPLGAQTSFSIGRDVRVYHRAWIVYDVQGATSGVGVKRAWNGLPVRGGFQRDPVTPGAWIDVIEEIDPSWLRAGSNTLDVRTSDDRTIRLRNLKLVLEVDDGRNSLSRIEAGDDLEMLRDGDPSTRWSLSGTTHAAVSLELDRTLEIDSVAVHVPAARQGKAVLEALDAGAWKEVPVTGEINTGAWTLGWNVVRVASAVAASSLRIRFLPSEPGLEIGEISVAGSAVGARTGIPRIVVRAPEHGEYWGDESYLWGWVSPTRIGGQVAQVTIGGAGAPGDPDGAFARAVTRADSTSGSSTGSWQVKVEARLADGTTLTRYVDFTEDRSAAEDEDAPVATGPAGPSGSTDPGVGESAPSSDEGRRGGSGANAPPRRSSKKIKPAEGGEVSLGRCDVVIPPFALREETEIVVEAVDEPEVPGLGPALLNVTSPYAACRFLPHGNFDRPVRVRVPYEAGLLPDGISADEISSHYYDEALAQWLPLKKIAVQKGTQQILSETTHFTDVIDGILVLPDHPTPLSYNPNSIRDLKAASPTAGIDFLEPPSANQSGAANLGFAIRVPPGRGGAEPSLAVRYSSGGGNGPMGLGWSLATSTISIDTRFGVPRYDGDRDELYTLDGSQLVRDGEVDGDPRYRQRIEGAFLQIVRHGDSPSTYSWEVTSKDGSRAIYGRGANSRLADPGGAAGHGEPVPINATRNIFQWFLEKTIDSNGNTVDYTYLQDEQPNNATRRLAGHPWTAAYLQRVQYSGHTSGEAGRYSVELSYADGYPGHATRPDLVIDGRAGFKTLWRKVLTSATVKFDSTVVRKYVFEYQQGEFQKTLLAAVVVRGRGDVDEFYRHTFQYEKRPIEDGEFKPFAGASIIDGAVEKSPLSQSKSVSEGGSLFVGLSVGGSRRLSIGARVGKEHSDEEGLITLVDINGDGLPDQAKPHEVRLNDGTGHLHEENASTLSQIDRSSTSSTSIGFEANAGPGKFALTFVHGKTEAKRILADVNGDGFVDVVGNGSVLFNTPDSDGVPHFASGGGAPENPGDFAVVSDEAQSRLEDQAFVVDPIVRWIAPFAGEVVISGAAMRLDTGSNPVVRHTRFGTGSLTASIWQNVPGTRNDERLWNATFPKLDHLAPAQSPAAADGNRDSSRS